MLVKRKQKCLRIDARCFNPGVAEEATVDALRATVRVPVDGVASRVTRTGLVCPVPH